MTLVRLAELDLDEAHSSPPARHFQQLLQRKQHWLHQQRFILATDPQRTGVNVKTFFYGPDRLENNLGVFTWKAFSA